MTGILALAAAWALVPLGCTREAEMALRPDSVLRAELGLTDADRVHRISISGGKQETLSPALVELRPGDWLEFVTLDWWTHEVRFEADSLAPDARAFLEHTDQVASPPLIHKGERYLLSFAGAPEARYPFVVEGNGAAGRGVVVVRPGR